MLPLPQPPKCKEKVRQKTLRKVGVAAVPRESWNNPNVEKPQPLRRLVCVNGYVARELCRGCLLSPSKTSAKSSTSCLQVQLGKRTCSCTLFLSEHVRRHQGPRCSQNVGRPDPLEEKSLSLPLESALEGLQEQIKFEEKVYRDLQSQHNPR